MQFPSVRAGIGGNQTASLPRVLFFGAGSGFPHVLQVDRTALDDDQPYTFRARGNPLVPATPTSELSVYASYVVITAKDTSAPLTLSLTLFVNQEAPIVRTFVVPTTVGEVRHQYQLAWFKPVIGVDGDERATVAPRGYRVVLELESVGLIPDGRFVIDGIETEISVESEDVLVDVT